MVDIMDTVNLTSGGYYGHCLPYKWWILWTLFTLQVVDIMDTVNLTSGGYYGHCYIKSVKGMRNYLVICGKHQN